MRNSARAYPKDRRGSDDEGDEKLGGYSWGRNPSEVAGAVIDEAILT